MPAAARLDYSYGWHRELRGDELALWVDLWATRNRLALGHDEPRRLGAWIPLAHVPLQLLPEPDDGNDTRVTRVHRARPQPIREGDTDG